MLSSSLLRKKPFLKKNMDRLAIVGFLIAFGSFVFAQNVSSELATAAGIKITSADLSEDARSLYEKQKEVVASNRKRIVERKIAEMLLNAEGRSRGTTGEQVLADEFKKLKQPTDAEIKAIYDANRAAIGNRSLEEVRPQIVRFLMQEPEEKAENEFLTRLKTKYRFSLGTDVNAIPRKPADVLFILDGKHYTVGEFEEDERIALNDVDVHIYEELHDAIEDALLMKLIEKEAAEKGSDPGAVIAAEITDKMREFSDAERASLWNALQRRLFAKYGARILLPEPKPLVLDVSADDDPFLGSATAPIIVVMFNDFQCGACAAFGPIARKVAVEFGDKVRLAVRDFPLEAIHENAFRAALAANAAGRQGKYFEYGAILYGNQRSLDDASLLRYAGELKLDLERFKMDMADPKNAEEIRRDIVDGKKYGVSGTPTVYINGIKHHGLSEPKFRVAIEKALNRVKY